MKINYITTLVLISIVYLSYVFPLTNQLFEKCEFYQNKVKEQIEILDVESRLISGKEWAYALSDEQNHETIDNAMKSIEEAHTAYDKAIEIAFHILWISLLFILLVIALNFKGNNLLKVMVGCTAIVSLILLYIGIYAPVLEISAYSKDLEIPLVLKLNEVLTLADLQMDDLANWINSDVNDTFQGYLNDLSFLGLSIPDFNLDLNFNLASYVDDSYAIEMTAKFHGDIYYYYQSKSAMGLINILFAQNNYVVGIALLTFSVIIPVIKLIMTVLITFFKTFSQKTGLVTIINMIGKWSMADVFVAACFLSYLSFNNMSNQIETESHTLLGLYFFLSYVVVSLISSMLMSMELKKAG